MCNFNTLFKTLYLIVSISIIGSAFAQTGQSLDLVKIKVIASGKTETAAITEALRSALTQTSSVFISSNTALINDELAKDEISMINNGSIAEYKIVDKAMKDDGTVFLTCDVTVSVNKLGSFVESVGGSTELKGGLFASNIKLMELNERAEERAIKDLLIVSHEILKKSFDYSIANGEPVSYGASWKVPLKVVITKNSNYDEFCRFFYTTIANIGMSDEELLSYSRLNKPICVLGLFDNSETEVPTPILRLSKDELLKDPSYSYFVTVSLGETRGAGDSLRPYSHSELTKLVYQRQREMLKGVPVFQREYVLNAYNYGRTFRFNDVENRILDDVFTANSKVKYLSIALRSANSIKSIEGFVYDYARIIQNVVLDNGLDSKNLSLITDASEEYSLVKLNEDMPLAFDAHGNFLSDFRERTPNYRSRDLLGCPDQEKMQGWLFDRVFANFIKYTYDLQCFSRKVQVTRTFPLQFSMVGGDSNIVYSFDLVNIVSLEEISKISKYSIKN